MNKKVLILFNTTNKMNKTRYKKPRNRFLIPADFLALFIIYTLNIYKVANYLRVFLATFFLPTVFLATAFLSAVAFAFVSAVAFSSFAGSLTSGFTILTNSKSNTNVEYGGI